MPCALIASRSSQSAFGGSPVLSSECLSVFQTCFTQYCLPWSTTQGPLFSHPGTAHFSQALLFSQSPQPLLQTGSFFVCSSQCLVQNRRPSLSWCPPRKGHPEIQHIIDESKSFMDYPQSLLFLLGERLYWLIQCGFRALAHALKPREHTLILGH